MLPMTPAVIGKTQEAGRFASDPSSRVHAVGVQCSLVSYDASEHAFPALLVMARWWFPTAPGRHFTAICHNDETLLPKF
jgi:hypothetical protein